MLALLHIRQEQGLHGRFRQLHAVHIHVFTARIATGTHNVLLCCRNQTQLKLFEKTAYRRKCLVLLLAYFYRKHHMAAILKPERHQGMSDHRAHPVRKEHIYRFERLQIVVLANPMLIKIGLAAPVKVTHIVQSHH